MSEITNRTQASALFSDSAVVAPDNARYYGRLARIVEDLDRCEHGRHASDPCFGCPGGQSTGNLLLPPGTVIGHGHGGEPISVPLDGQDRYDVRSWRGGLTR